MVKFLYGCYEKKGKSSRRSIPRSGIRTLLGVGTLLGIGTLLVDKGVYF